MREYIFVIAQITGLELVSLAGPWKHIQPSTATTQGLNYSHSFSVVNCATQFHCHPVRAGDTSHMRTMQSSPAVARMFSIPDLGHHDMAFTSLTPCAEEMRARSLSSTTFSSVT
jgi:hypothetical protein